MTIEPHMNISINDNLIVYNESIWYVAPEFQMLVEVNRNNGSVCYVCNLPGIYSHRHIARFGENLYLFPFNANSEIIEFNIIDKQIKTIKKTNKPNSRNANNSKIHHSLNHKQSIFAFGDLPLIPPVNVLTNEVFVHKEILNELTGCEYQYYFWRACYAEDNLLVIPFYSAPKILIFNMDNWECKVVDIDTEEKTYGINCIDFDGKDYWLSTVRNGYHILRWNRAKNTIHRIKIRESSMPEEDIPFFGLTCYGEDVWLLPAKSNYAYRIGPDNKINKLSNIPALDAKDLKNDWKFNYMNCIKFREDCILSMNIELQLLIEIDMCNGNVKETHINIPYSVKNEIKKQIKRQMINHIKRNDAYKENEYGEIKAFICCIRGINNSVKKVTPAICAGQRIYSHIVK